MHCRSFKIILLVALTSLCAPASVLGDALIQTDWADGPGVLGPVSSWGSGFYSSSDIDWSTCSGSISMLRSPFENIMASGYDGARFVHIADIDGDGDMDVVSAASEADEISWWENTGTGSSFIQHVIDTQSLAAVCTHTADINDDGELDVLAAATAGWEIAWYRNEGSGLSWTKFSLTDTYMDAHRVHSADIDCDGDMDILSAGATVDDITWWENRSGIGMSWKEHVIAGDFDGAYCVYPEDINGDGYIDVVGSARYADAVMWWENSPDDPGDSWTQHTVATGIDFAYSAIAADINGDGYSDILGSARYAGDVIWWQNIDGSGNSWSQHYVDRSFEGASEVVAVDLDGDGDLDILGSAEYDDVITWWENADGIGTEWFEHNIDDYCHDTNCVAAGDLTGDGMPEAVCSAFSGDEITFWDLNIYPGLGWLTSSIVDVDTYPCWGEIDWDAQTPDGTEVVLQLRASNDHEQMGEWSDSLFAPCPLDGVIDDGKRYLQYRIILLSSADYSTANLDEIAITWDPLGIGSGGSQGPMLHPVCPNPAGGSPVVMFTIAETSSVRLLVYDINGRLVHGITDVEYCPGYHSLQLNDLASGMYICRMQAGEYTASRRFVVIR